MLAIQESIKRPYLSRRLNALPRRNTFFGQEGTSNLLFVDVLAIVLLDGMPLMLSSVMKRQEFIRAREFQTTHGQA
jgi:hypothetical protein